MTWLPISQFLAVSADQKYELYGAYFNGHFAWRGRVIETDQLVQASADRGYVQLCCDRHAAKAAAAVAAEASA